MVTVGQSLLLQEAVNPTPRATAYTYHFMSLGASLDTGGAWEERGTHSVLPDLSAGLAVSAFLGLGSHLQSKRLLQLTVNQNGIPSPYRLLRPRPPEEAVLPGDVWETLIIFQTMEQRRKQSHRSQSHSSAFHGVQFPQGTGRQGGALGPAGLIAAPT